MRGVHPSTSPNEDNRAYQTSTSIRAPDRHVEHLCVRDRADRLMVRVGEQRGSGGLIPANTFSTGGNPSNLMLGINALPHEIYFLYASLIDENFD